LGGADFAQNCARVRIVVSIVLVAVVPHSNPAHLGHCRIAAIVVLLARVVAMAAEQREW
jgi:hypothetical protein